VSILVKMDPSESEIMPDLLLTFDSELVEDFNKVFDQLDRGSKIGFNGTIKGLGSEINSRHLHAYSIIKLEGYKEIAPHVHDAGRYADKKNIRGNT